MKRREFITLLGGAAATWPRAAEAQQTDRLRRVGVLMNGTATETTFHGSERAAVMLMLIQTASSTTSILYESA